MITTARAIEESYLRSGKKHLRPGIKVLLRVHDDQNSMRGLCHGLSPEVKLIP
jgi:hypothetical protein